MDGFRLSRSKWEGGDGLEEIVSWGVNPAIALVDVLDDLLDNEDFSNGSILYILNELECKLEDIENIVYKFKFEIHKKEKTPETAIHDGRDPGAKFRI